MSELTDLLLQVMDPVTALMFVGLVFGGYLAYRSLMREVERMRSDLADRIDTLRGRINRLEDSHIPEHPDYQRRANDD